MTNLDPRPFTAKGQRTRSAILDAAERQFAERGGFDGVSLRQIIQEASVQMGQLQHYFASKEDIFASVLERRLAAVSARYAEALDDLDRPERDPVDLRAVIRATLAISREWLSSDDPGKHRYLKMLGLSTMRFNQPDYVTRHGEAFKPLNDRVVAWLARLYPEAPAESVQTAFYLIESTMLSLFVNIDSILARSGRERTMSAVSEMFDDLEIFLVSGVEPLLTA